MANTNLGITQSVNTNNIFATVKALSTKRALGLKDAPINSYGGISANDNIICQNEINGGSVWSRSDSYIFGNMYIGGNVYSPNNMLSTPNGLVITKPIIPDPTYKFPIDFSPLFNFTTGEPAPPPAQLVASKYPQDNYVTKRIGGIEYKKNKYVLSDKPSIDFGGLDNRWDHIFSTNLDTIYTLSIFGDYEEMDVHKNIRFGTNVKSTPILEINQTYADTVKISGSLEIVDLNNISLLQLIHDTSQLIINGDVDINGFVKIDKDEKTTNIDGKLITQDVTVKHFLEMVPQLINVKHNSVIVDISSSIIFVQALTSGIINLNIDKHHNNVIIKIILKYKKEEHIKIKIQLNKNTYCKLYETNDYVEILYYNGNFEFLSGKKPNILIL